MRKQKTSVALITLVILTLLLAGCGDPTTPVTTNPATTTSVAATTGKTAQTSAAATTTKTQTTTNTEVANKAITPTPKPTNPAASSRMYRVLFDASHGETAGNADWVISNRWPDPLEENQHPNKETDWTGGISAWGIALFKTGRYSMETLGNRERITYGDNNNKLDLKNFDAFVAVEPNNKFTDSEKLAILRFVENGGGLFMIADHTGSDRNNDGVDSPQIWNDLMNNNLIGKKDVFGLQFDLDNIDNENPNNLTPDKDPLTDGPFGKGRGSILRNGTTITLNPATNPNVKGVLYRNKFSNKGNTGVFIAHSQYGKGRVVAWGDSSTVDDGTGRAGEQLYNGWSNPAATNDIFALNATEWLVSASK